jgi:hypothetical protein
MTKDAFSFILFGMISLIVFVGLLTLTSTISYAQQPSDPPLDSEFSNWLATVRGKADAGKIGKLISADRRPAIQVGSRSARSNLYTIDIEGRSVEVEVLTDVKPSKGTGRARVTYYDTYTDTEASIGIYQNENVLTVTKGGSQFGTVRWTSNFTNNYWLYNGFSYSQIAPWSSQAIPFAPSNGASSLARSVGFSSAVRPLTPYIASAILYSSDLYYGALGAGVPWQTVQPLYEAASVSSTYGWGVPPAF